MWCNRCGAIDVVQSTAVQYMQSSAAHCDCNVKLCEASLSIPKRIFAMRLQCETLQMNAKQCGCKASTCEAAQGRAQQHNLTLRITKQYTAKQCKGTHRKKNT
eukprot:4699980-Pyramimonas_sp.AAC.1